MAVQFQVTPQYLHRGEFNCKVIVTGISPTDTIKIFAQNFGVDQTDEVFDDRHEISIHFNNGYPHGSGSTINRYELRYELNGGSTITSDKYFYLTDAVNEPVMSASSSDVQGEDQVVFTVTGTPSILGMKPGSLQFGIVENGEIISSDLVSINDTTKGQTGTFTVSFKEDAPSGDYTFGAKVDFTQFNFEPAKFVSTTIHYINTRKDESDMALPSGWSYNSSTGKLTYTGSDNYVGANAFMGNKDLGLVVIPTGIVETRATSFYSCTNITKVDLPDGFTTLGDGTFQNCSKLQEISIPATLQSIGLGAFGNTHDPLSVYYAGTKSQWAAISGIDASNHKGNLVVTCSDGVYDPNEASSEDPTTPTEPETEPEGEPDPIDPDGSGTSADAEDPLCITPTMLELLVTQILGKVNERIAARIVNVISDTSDDKHVPSALAVFNFLRTVTPGMSCQTVVGSMDSVTEPNSRIIYLQKDDENDQTWTMYLWVDGAWVSIGDTSIDLVNYWSKSDADIAELREKILTTDAIQGISDTLDLANVLRNDEATKAIVLEWIGSTSVDNIGETGMASIIEAVLAEADKLYVKKDELTETLGEYAKKDELHAQPAVITETQITTAVNAAFAATEPAM